MQALVGAASYRTILDCCSELLSICREHQIDRALVVSVDGDATTHAALEEALAAMAQAGVPLAEYAARASRDLAMNLPRPVTILITSDEEVSSPTSRNLIEEEARRSAYVLVMESPLPGGVLKTSRKGVGDFTLKISGRAAQPRVESVHQRPE